MKKIFWPCYYCHQEVFNQGVGKVLKIGREKRAIAHQSCVLKVSKLTGRVSRDEST